MFLELYYEHYGTKDYYEKWDGEEKVLPYLVRFTSYEEMKDFKDFLRSEGFRQVDLSSNFIGIYINVRFKTFAQIQKAVWSSCVDDRYFTPEEFMENIYTKYVKKEKEIDNK